MHEAYLRSNYFMREAGTTTTTSTTTTTTTTTTTDIIIIITRIEPSGVIRCHSVYISHGGVS